MNYEKKYKKEKQYITITQKILDYVSKYEYRFENSIPKLGDSWKVIKICKYPSVNDGKLVVKVVNEDSGDWMRLPLNIVDIKIGQKQQYVEEMQKKALSYAEDMLSGVKSFMPKNEYDEALRDFAQAFISGDNVAVKTVNEIIKGGEL